MARVCAGQRVVGFGVDTLIRWVACRLVVFLRKVRTASGATAVQIAERAGGRDKVIEHLGSAHTDGELAVLMEAGRLKMHAGQGELDLVVGQRDSRDAVVRGQASRVLIEVIEGAWRRLGFDVVGDDAFFQLVLARLVEPTSKADSVRVLTELGLTPAHRNTFTATLSSAIRMVAGRTLREKIFGIMRGRLTNAQEAMIAPNDHFPRWMSSTS